MSEHKTFIICSGKLHTSRKCEDFHKEAAVIHAEDCHEALKKAKEHNHHVTGCCKKCCCH